LSQPEQPTEANNQPKQPFQPFTNISVGPEGIVLTHYLAPGLCIAYALGPDGVRHIRDQWNQIEAEQQAYKDMPRPPLGLVLPMSSRVD
jgi:hypothetical protein